MDERAPGVSGRPVEGDEAEPQAVVEELAPGEIRRQRSVQDALKEASRAAAPDKTRSPVRRILVFGVLSGALGLLYAFSERGVLWSELTRTETTRRALLAALVVTGLVALYAALSTVILSRVRQRAVRYNVRRVLQLAFTLLLVFSAVSILFVGWYGTAVSLGLLSLILGFALQAPLTSFFAWIYLLARAPYRIGDRIRIGQATGDVIDVGYLDTTLWEFGGEFLSTDHPSGRIIRFPNSTIFNSTVYNYSWPLFPYIWNEITVQVAYESDLEHVANVMRSTVEDELGPKMSERVSVYRGLLAETPVDQLEVDDRPSVLFRVNPNTWIDASVRYLVTPRRAGRRKTLLTKRILERLNATPDKVMFPKANMR
ncbi:MAG TPA: mechanosensitive ion channel family protein [Thermoanaerobaculia bacterium]|jgi:small-conductance mechanosensitive channel